MKNNYICYFILFVSIYSNAQTWQWGKQGGASDQLGTTTGHRQEEVTHIATDSENNVYVISSVGMTNLEIDGNPKTNYGDSTTKTDYAIASFACDGTYRWSKIIGSSGFDLLHSVHVDNDDNIYVAGSFGGSSGAVYEQHIDEDVIFPSNPVNHQRLILIKYNKDGVLQWYRKPQPPDVTQTVSNGQTSSRGYAADDLGNSYWLVQLPPGTYADGAFVNTMEGSNFFILKYDANGTFVNATHIDMQLGGSTAIYLKFFRNPNNGNYYFTTVKPPDVTITINGTPVTHSTFLACFNAQGQFLWTRENTGTLEGTTRIQSIVFDSQNNIYLNARMIGTLDSFAGFSFPQSIASMAVMKLDPEANAAIWGTYYNHNGANLGAVALNGDELGYAGYAFSSNFTWGSQSIFVSNNNEGTEVLLARFNKENGECLSLSKIPGDIGHDDFGTALAVDGAGDYIVGGGFKNYLYFDNDAQLDNDGLQTDFFVAKYGTGDCSCSAPVPSFGYTPSTETNYTVGFTYTGDAYDSISWNFGDGSEPSAEANPTYTYAAAGSYEACVTVSNDCGSEQHCQTVDAIQCPAPIPSFSYAPSTETNYTVSFTYTGDDYETISWDFGDGSEPSSEIAPTYTYAGAGSYEVCVTVSNSCGSEQHCQQVSATLDNKNNVLANIKVYPNPVEDILTISADQELSYTLYSVLGAVIENGSLATGETQVNLESVASGWYMLKLQNKTGEQRNVELFKR